MGDLAFDFDFRRTSTVIGVVVAAAASIGKAVQPAQLIRCVETFRSPYRQRPPSYEVRYDFLSWVSHRKRS